MAAVKFHDVQLNENAVQCPELREQLIITKVVVMPNMSLISDVAMVIVTGPCLSSPN